MVGLVISNLWKVRVALGWLFYTGQDFWVPSLTKQYFMVHVETVGFELLVPLLNSPSTWRAVSGLQVYKMNVLCDGKNSSVLAAESIIIGSSGLGNFHQMDPTF